MTAQYVSSASRNAVAQWAAGHTYGAGSIVRQLAAPAVGSERCFRTALGGVSAGAEPAWVLTAGSASPVDNTITDWTEVTGNPTYNWSAPHARIANAQAAGWAAAGDKIYVGNDHAYSVAASYPMTNIGTDASPSIILCVKTVANGGSVPPVESDITTGASETATGAATLTLGATQTGITYINGILFQSGNGATANSLGVAGQYIRMDNCTLKLGGTTSGNMTFTSANANGVFESYNTTFNFSGAVGSSIVPQGILMRLFGGALAGTAIPTTLFGAGGLTPGRAQIEVYGMDLSAAGSGKTIFGAFTETVRALFKNCKLGASVTLGTQQTKFHGSRVVFDGCDVSGSNSPARQFVNDYFGTLTTELTNVRSGGASDGTTNYAWKIQTTANTEPFFGAFETIPIAKQNVIAGAFSNASMTATVEILFDASVDTGSYTNADIWLEAEYLSNSGTPQTVTVSGGLATVLGTGSALTASSATWTTTGMTTPTTKKLQVTFTPAMNGIIKFTVKVAAASLTTLRVDPKVVLA